jgi:hypothetical protein
MTDVERIAQLEELLASFLRPIKGIPFPIVIKALCDRSVENIDPASPEDQMLIADLSMTAKFVADAVQGQPIKRPRPNEVGNDLEPFVLQAANQVGLSATAPKSASGRVQQVGYPDILISDRNGRPTYLEVKSFADASEPTSMRSFYLSPSANPKVSVNARHLVLGFGMQAIRIEGSRDSLYNVASFKLINLFDLECDVKYEFNSDNRRLYSEGLLLASGRFDNMA